MGVFKSLSIFIAGLAMFGLFNFGMMTQTVSAEVSDSSIQNGLCNGADLKITDQPCSNANEQGVEKISKAVTKFINTLSLIVGIVAVVMIMVGGLRYITSGGSDTSVTSAKNTILYAIIGLIIVALSQVMVHFVLKQLS